MENRPAPLRSRRVCRFCLTESEPLSYIYERDHNKPFQVPLTLQIMSCVAIEVYSADGMPQMICNLCRWNLDRSYRFKLQCKKADEALRDYPLSGVLPRPFPPIPNDPPEISNKRSAESKPQNESVKKPRTETPERRETREREREREREKERERERDREREKQSEKQKEKSSNDHDFYKEEDQDGGSEAEQDATSGEHSIKDEGRKLEPGEIRVHACNQCNRTFPLRQALALHVLRAHRDRNYKCTECDRMFFSKYDLGKHMSTHSEEKPHSCQICQKQFSRQSLLQRHEKLHRDEMRYGCHHCDREFFSTEELEKHEDASHKKEKPFQCNICNKRFQYKQGLERHEMLHNEDKTFVCEYCKEAFHTSTKLARHLSTHAGHRPYLCKMCPRSFLLSHHLTRHMRTHSVEKRHICEDCGKAFKRKESLEVHQLTHTKRSGMALTCDVCQESCRNRADYVTHIKQHIEAGEKMGPDGLQPDIKNKVELDSDEEEEDEDQYSDGDDDYEPPAYIAKKMPKPLSRPTESDEEDDESQSQRSNERQEKEEQRKEQVVFVRGKDGNMVKKTIKTLMPIQRRDVQEKTAAIKQSPTSSTSQSGAKGSSVSQMKQEDSIKNERADETEAQVQKIVASVFKEHKIPLKHQNVSLDQSNKEGTRLQTAATSQEARKTDDKADPAKNVNTVRVIKRILVRKSGGNTEVVSNVATPITKDSDNSLTTLDGSPVSGSKVTKRVIVRRIIRQGDTTREIVMNPDGTVIDPADLAKLPTGNVVRRLVVKPLTKVGHNLMQAVLQSVDPDATSSEVTTPTMPTKFELKTSSGSGVSNTPKSSTSQKGQVTTQGDQETKEKLEQLEKRVEQQRLKIEELQARKQEYEAIDEMLPERHDESEDEQQLPLKRVFVKRKQSIYDEVREYNDETETTTQIKDDPIKKEETLLKEEDEPVADEISESEVHIESQKTTIIDSSNTNTATTTAATTASTIISTSTPKKGPIISSSKVYTNKRYMIVKPSETSEVEEMNRELRSILETTDDVMKMQETVLSNLTQISSVITDPTPASKTKDEEDASSTITTAVNAEQVDSKVIKVEDCDNVENIKTEEEAMEVEVATHQETDSTQIEVEETTATQIIVQEENNSDETTAAHLTLDTQDLTETSDIFESSDDVLVEVQKSSNLNDSVMELPRGNNTINLNDTNDSQDSLEDKLSQMEG